MAVLEFGSLRPVDRAAVGACPQVCQDLGHLQVAELAGLGVAPSDAEVEGHPSVESRDPPASGLYDFSINAFDFTAAGNQGRNINSSAKHNFD